MHSLRQWEDKELWRYLCQQAISPFKYDVTHSTAVAMSEVRLTRLIACARDLPRRTSVTILETHKALYSPLVAAACCFTASLSRLKALSSAPCKPLDPVLADLRWKADRTVCERNCAAARNSDRWGNIVWSLLQLRFAGELRSPIWRSVVRWLRLLKPINHPEMSRATPMTSFTWHRSSFATLSPCTTEWARQRRYPS